MDTTFAMRLAELRKETDKNQKDAAADLGISQALLSHYEKGIRECTLDFVVRVSEYYDVSCDYLLGKCSFKSWLSEKSLLERDIPEDKIWNTQTATRVASYMRERMKNENNAVNEQLYRHYTLCLYRLIFTWVNAGYLPKSWLGETAITDNVLYSRYLQAVSDWLLNIEKNPDDIPEEEAPLFIKTLMAEMDKYVDSQLTTFYRNLDN